MFLLLFLLVDALLLSARYLLLLFFKTLLLKLLQSRLFGFFFSLSSSDSLELSLLDLVLLCPLVRKLFRLGSLDLFLPLALELLDLLRFFFFLYASFVLLSDVSSASLRALLCVVVCAPLVSRVGGLIEGN